MRAIAALAVSALLVAVSAAPGDARQGAAHKRKEVVVGAILDLARGWTSLGRGSRVTLQLAAADANAALARNHSPVRVRLRIVDAKGEPALALRGLRALAASGVRIVIGPEGSSEVAAVRRAAAPVWRRDARNAGLERSVRRQFAARGGKVSQGVPYGEKTPNFTAVATSIAAEAGALRAGGATHVGVYLAGFDEVVDLFHAARVTPTLQSYPWYGSDGVALSTRLVNDKPAAAF